MSQENVETVKQLTEAFHRRDIDAFAQLTTADVEWEPVFATQVEGAVYLGRAGIEAFLRELSETWDEFRPVGWQLRLSRGRDIQNPDLPRSLRSPQSRRAGGVGDV